MSLPSGVMAATAREAQECIFLVRIGSDPVQRYTSHILGWELPSDDDVDPEGEYLAGGVLLTVPEISALTGTEAIREDFVFARTEATLSWVFGPDRIYSGNQVDVDFAYLYINDDGTPASDPLWLTSLTADIARYRLNGGTETIALSCHSGDIESSKTFPVYFSDASHQAKHPGDLFFNNMNWMNVLSSVKWPE